MQAFVVAGDGDHLSRIGGLPTTLIEIAVHQIRMARARTTGAYAVTNHLLELGHRRIAIITGPQHVSTASDRVQGYLRALDEAGISDESGIYWGEFIQQTGYDYAQRLLRAVPRPTAIFAANNFIAIGVMRALRDARVSVPEEMSVVAFDDLPEAITIDPFFTVAAQPTYELGQRATELLLSRLAGNGPEGYQEVVLPVEIIVRKSSGKPPTLVSHS